MSKTRPVVILHAEREGKELKEIDRREGAFSMADAVAIASEDYEVLRPADGGNFEKVHWDGDGTKAYTITVK
jgi:hypothetical protein